MSCCFTSDCQIFLQLKMTLICRRVRLQHEYRQQRDDFSTYPWFKGSVRILHEHFIVIVFSKLYRKRFNLKSSSLNLLFSQENRKNTSSALQRDFIYFVFCFFILSIKIFWRAKGLSRASITNPNKNTLLYLLNHFKLTHCGVALVSSGR